MPIGNNAKDDDRAPSCRCLLTSADDTQTLGARLAQAMHGGMVLALSGELGAGKTTLVRGMLRALGFDDAVKSPSYTLVEEYPFSHLNFYHFDFYRFRTPEEWDTSGFAEYFRDDALCVIEWPEKLGDRLPTVDIMVILSWPDAQHDTRYADITFLTPAGRACQNVCDPQPSR